MKFLIVKSNGDYGALNFNNNWSCTPVIDVINNQSNYLPTERNKFDGEEWYFEVKEFEDVTITAEFIEFLKNQILDYDYQKHEQIYAEFEKV